MHRIFFVLFLGLLMAGDHNDLLTVPTRVIVGWKDMYPTMSEEVTALSIKREGNKYRVLPDSGAVMWVDWYKPVLTKGKQ